MKTRPSRPGILVLAVLLLAGALLGVIGLRTPRNDPLPDRVAAAAVPGPVYDLKGVPVEPLAHVDGRAVVFIFVGIDCPVPNQYAPEIRRLHDEYTPKGVKVWVVYPDADCPAEDILRHQAEYRLPPEVLRDPAHALVARSRASVTPEAAVFLPAGQLVYHGRIDNRQVDFGSARPAATEHDLRQVLQRILQGEAVTPFSTRAVGCSIPRVR